MSKLTDYLQTKTTKISIMEGRTHEDLRALLDKEVTINNYDFLTGDNGDYAVITIKEDKDTFYFASSVLTDELKQIDNAGLKEDVIEEGIKVKLTERKTKNGKRTYIAVNYIN